MLVLFIITFLLCILNFIMLKLDKQYCETKAALVFSSVFFVMAIIHLILAVINNI